MTEMLATRGVICPARPTFVLHRSRSVRRLAGEVFLFVTVFIACVGCRSWTVVRRGEEVLFGGRRTYVQSDSKGALVPNEEEIHARFLRFQEFGLLIVQSSAAYGATPENRPACRLQLLDSDGGPAPYPGWNQGRVEVPPARVAAPLPELLNPTVGVPRNPWATPKTVPRSAILGGIDPRDLEGGEHPLSWFPAKTRFSHEMRTAEGNPERWELHRTVAGDLPVVAVDGRGKILAFGETFVLDPGQSELVGYRREVLMEGPGPAGAMRWAQRLELKQYGRRQVEPDEERLLSEQIHEIFAVRSLMERDLDGAEARLRALLSRYRDGPLLEIARLYQAAIRRTRHFERERVLRARLHRVLDRSRVEPAPDLVGRSLDGRAISLLDFRGSVVLLNFWTTGCPPCRSEMSQLEALRNRYENAGLIVLGLNRDENEQRAKDFAKAHLRYPSMVGMWRAFEDYEVVSLPCTLLLDDQGQIRYRHVGVPGATAREELETAIAFLLEEATTPASKFSGD